MASLLTLAQFHGRERGACERDPAEGLRGRLDPLTLATYRWRLINGAYDSESVLDYLAKRLTVEIQP